MKIAEGIFSQDFDEAVEISFSLSYSDWSRLQRSRHWKWMERFIRKREKTEQFIVCPCCREKVLKSDNFCMHCGRDLRK